MVLTKTELSEKKTILLKKLFFNKEVFMFLIVLFVVCSQSFAGSNGSDTIEKLDTWGNNILSIFSSGWVKALACVALIMEAVGMIVAGQQGGGGAIIKKFGPWIIGTVILLCASGITNYFLKDLSFDELSFFWNQPAVTLFKLLA